MVLTKEELLRSLRHEIQILLHLAGKVDSSMLEYRPTPKQRSTLELLRYLAIMGPTQISCIQSDGFNRPALSAAWSAAEQASNGMTFEQAVEAIRVQADEYAGVLGGWSVEDFRSTIDMFGTTMSRGAAVVSLILNAHAAYRMQLFCYLKSCGREELGTMDLWAGVDQPKR